MSNIIPGCTCMITHAPVPEVEGNLGRFVEAVRFIGHLYPDNEDDDIWEVDPPIDGFAVVYRGDKIVRFYVVKNQCPYWPAKYMRRIDEDPDAKVREDSDTCTI